MLEFNSYQIAASETAIYRESIKKYVESLGISDETKQAELQRLLCRAYAILGLVSEAGELAGAYKKIIRDSGSSVSPEKTKEFLKENGDVTWYNSQVSYEFGENYATTAKNNIDKLLDRKNRGVIGGSGDNR